MRIKIISLFSCFTVVLSSPLFLEDCNIDSNINYVRLNSASVKEDQITSPGNVTICVNVTVLKSFEGAQLDLKLKLERKFWGIFWYDVPCSYGFGSCTYDFCDLFADTACPSQLTNNGVPCTCGTILPGNYVLNDVMFYIPPDSWSFFFTGDYRVEATLTQQATGDEVGCLTGTFTLS